MTNEVCDNESSLKFCFSAFYFWGVAMYYDLTGENFGTDVIGGNDVLDIYGRE